MTRTDVVASSRPQKAGAAPMRKGSSSAMRRLLVLPVAFALTMALVLPATAPAAEGLSGYNNKPTTTSTTPTPTTGTSPSKESSTPTKTTAPEATKSEPTTSTEPTAKKASTLPFTGFDLRWTVGGGVLLIAMGFSLVMAQRRQRRDPGR
jgi:hypothetical protein